MNLKIITVAMLLSAPTFAAGICIVCPPGYDCSAGTPVAHTGNARLATIGDIPTTAAQVGAVPATRSIAGFALSGDITLEQLRDVLDVCPFPIAGTAGKGTIDAMCSTTNGTQNVAGNPSSTSGRYCWCRFKKTGIYKPLSEEDCNPSSSYSSWVRSGECESDGRCPGGWCGCDCSVETSWRAASVWL